MDLSNGPSVGLSQTRTKHVTYRKNGDGLTALSDEARDGRRPVPRIARATPLIRYKTLLPTPSFNHVDGMRNGSQAAFTKNLNIMVIEMNMTIFSPERKAFHQSMAHAYRRFLTYLLLENAGDNALLKGMNEAHNKFLSNYYIESAPIPALFPSGGRVAAKYAGSSRRYLLGDYYSEDALKVLRDASPSPGGLRFERIVPKAAIREKCENKIKDHGNALTVADIGTMLDDSWHIAVITNAEERKLFPKMRMPPDWQADHGIFVRYLKDQVFHFPMWRTVEDQEVCLEFLS
jgi:hypothetical protein